MTKVLIAIPSFDIVYADFAMSLASLAGQSIRDSAGREVKLSIVNEKNSIIPMARTVLVEKALDLEATHVLFIDSDMVFPGTALQQLLFAKRDIVCATYVKRYAPHDILGEPDLTKRPENGLQQMLTAPLGMCLIKTKVFKQISKPWFDWPTPGWPGPGEDTFFFRKVKEAGFEIWCDISLTRQCAHITNKAMRPK